MSKTIENSYYKMRLHKKWFYRMTGPAQFYVKKLQGGEANNNPAGSKASPRYANSNQPARDVMSCNSNVQNKH